MIEEGRIALEIGWDGNRVTTVSIRSTRTPDPSRLLEGRCVAQAIETVPLLFSVCGRAQVVAAALASEAARGELAEPGLARLRSRMVAAERLHETLWHLLLDLPPLLGEAPQHEEFVAMRRRLARIAGRIGARARWWDDEEAGDAAGDRCWCDLADEARAFLARVVYGMDCDVWLSLAEDDFMGWKDRGATPTAARLARLCATDLGDDETPALPAGPELLDAIAPALEASGEFVRLPSWKGAPAETGAWARQAKDPRMRLVRGIGARMLARLVELARLPRRLRDAGASFSRMSLRPGVGLAAVETARGTLVHAVTIEEGKLARLRIVAPTEWNFHPEGAFARGLVGFAACDEAQVARAAAMLAHALDPCVAFAIRVEHA